MVRFKSALSSITTWFAKNENERFCDDSHNRYVEYLEQQVIGGNQSKIWSNTKLRCLDQMRSYHHTGQIDFNYNRCSRIEYVPSENALATIATIFSEHSYKQRTKDTHSSYMRKFYCFIEEQGLTEQDITREEITAFIQLSSKTARESLEGVCGALRILSRHLVAAGILSECPDFKFIAPKVRTRKILPAYTEEEVNAILDSIDRTTAVGKRNYAIILFAVSTGIRAVDIINMEFSDIDWEKQTISIIQEKTNVWHKTAISGQVSNALADYILGGRPKSDVKNVFIRERAPFVAFTHSAALDKIIDRQCERAGVEKKDMRSFHGLRRTFGTWLAREGVDTSMLAQMLGQRDMRSSKVYLSFNDAELSKCAMDFADIPIKGGVYCELG